MTTFISPIRLYNFSDARLIEIVLEKVVFAERDATELLTVGIDAAWVEDLKNQVLAVGAMPTDIIEVAEQKEATDEKDEDADLLMDKLKELRSAAKRALGEKSSDYGAFGFKEMDKFKDSDLLKLALVIPALTAKNAVVLATKGWLAADNTELANMLSTFVTGIQNQAMETGSRDNATESRIKEGNAIYKLLENELCEAGKSYWRTRSEAKYNDYIVYNTPSGSSGTKVLEGDAPAGTTQEVDATDLEEASTANTAKFEITGNPLKFYASATPGGEPAGSVLEVPIGTVTMPVSEMLAQMGFTTPGPELFLTVRNTGMADAQYKITITD